MNPCNPSPPRNTYVCMYVYVLKTIQVYKYIYSFSACSSEQDPTPLFTNILSDSRRTTRSLSPTTIADERARGESLASKRGTKCTQKRPCPEMHGFCNFALFVHQKSKAPERVKRDPHLFDLVIFLHPKKCLTCGRKVSAPFGSGNGPRNLCLVVFWTSN